MTVSRKLKRYRGWIAGIALVVIAVIAYMAFQQSGVVEETTTYTTEPASIGVISVTVSGTGNLEVDGMTEVWPVANGTVSSLKVAEGDLVATGTVLFTLDASDAAANTSKAYASYKQSQQGVTQAESQLLKAENNLDDLEDRYDEQLSDDGSDESTAQATPSTNEEVTQSDIDAAEKDVEVAKAGLTSANASCQSALLSYQNAQAAEADLTVKAPVAGVIYSLDIEDGDSVSAAGGTSSAGGTGTTSSGAPMTIVPEQSLAVHLTVNEVDVPAIAVGQRGDIEFDAFSDLSATGKVYDISDEGLNTQGVVTFDVWLTLDAPSDELRPGMSAAATIVTAIANDTLTVPNAAVRSDGSGGYYVEILGADGEPARVNVEIGLTSATDTEILSGIDEGDEVVTQTLSSSDGEEESGGGLMLPGMGGGRGQ